MNYKQNQSAIPFKDDDLNQFILDVETYPNRDLNFGIEDDIQPQKLTDLATKEPEQTTPLEDTVQVAQVQESQQPIVFDWSINKVQNRIGSVRAKIGTPPATQAPAEAHQVEDNLSVTSEMMAAAGDFSSFLQTHAEQTGPVAPIATKEDMNQAMSSNKEMEWHNLDLTVNYYDDSKHLDFGGLKGQEHLEKTIEKNDYQGFLMLHSPQLNKMNDGQNTERKALQDQWDNTLMNEWSLTGE